MWKPVCNVGARDVHVTGSGSCPVMRNFELYSSVTRELITNITHNTVSNLQMKTMLIRVVKEFYWALIVQEDFVYV